MTDEPSEEPVPKLPRGKGVSLSGPQLMRIGLTAVTLLALLTLRRPCSDAVGGFVANFGGAPAGASGGASGEAPAPRAPAAPPPGAPAAATEYERLSPSMTDDELRAAIERAKRRAAAEEARQVAPSAEPASAPAEPAHVRPASAPADRGR
ncbi:MAG: hypothetical protein R3B48_08110 [Kofleriaceae bacterium]